MQPTKPLVLLAIGVACAIVAWFAVRATFANLPPLPWTAIPALLLLTLGELLLGRSLRARLAGRPGTKPIQPMAVPRVVALAKASSTAAAVFCGAAVGAISYAIELLDKPVPRHDALIAGFTALAAVTLAVAALYLERSCRPPGRPDDSDDLSSQNGQRGRRG